MKVAIDAPLHRLNDWLGEIDAITLEIRGLGIDFDRQTVRDGRLPNWVVYKEAIAHYWAAYNESIAKTFAELYIKEQGE